jgi:hypothetical protein
MSSVSFKYVTNSEEAVECAGNILGGLSIHIRPNLSLTIAATFMKPVCHVSINILPEIPAVEIIDAAKVL